MSAGRWATAKVAESGWVRRMFDEGVRLRGDHGPENVFDLSLGQPLDEPPLAAREALLRVAAERGRERFGYMPNLGLPAARARAAADVAHQGVDAACVCMTSGAGAALVVALRTFCDAGDEVLGSIPFFGEYPLYCEAIGTRFVPVASASEGSLDLDAIAGALSERTRAMLLNTPNNPSGRVTSIDELRGLGDILRTHQVRTGRTVILVLDEVYHRLVYDGDAQPDAFAAYESTVLCRSFSKDLGLAGERIGYLAVHPSLAGVEMERALATCQRALGFVNAPATMQRMLVELPNWTTDLGAHQERRDHAVTHARAAGLDLVTPRGGLYLWVRSPWDDGMAFVEALAKRHVLTAPGIAFGMPDHLRICFTAPRAAIERGMAEAGALLGTAAG